MKTVIVFLFATLAACNAAKVPPSFQPRIVNGENVKLGEMLYMASIHSNDRYVCGGAIIHPYFVLTAAHCVADRQQQENKVIAGVLDLRDAGKTHDIAEYIIHEDFDRIEWMNDIALLKVTEPFAKEPYVLPINLPRRGEQFQPLTKAVVSGWGKREPNGPTSTILQKAEVVLNDPQYCKSIYRHIEVDKQMCANNPWTEIGACTGDSGSPLVYQDTVIGIVSILKGCGLSTSPTVYVRVSNYVDWINKVLWKNCCSSTNSRIITQ